MSKVSIKQIIPANGWYAAYRYEGDDKTYYGPLACWALIEDSDGFIVVGMDGRDVIESVEYVSNFDGYIHESYIKEKNPSMDKRGLSSEALKGGDAGQ